MRVAELILRPAVQSDLPAMLRLWREMMDFHAESDPRFQPKPYPEGEHAWESFIGAHAWTNVDWRVLVAESDGQIVGHIVGALRHRYPVFEPARFGVVMDIVVNADARRSGVGRKLFAELVAWFRERGAAYVELEVAHRNATSQAFWRALGCTDYTHTLRYDLEAS